ncbi:hypothetical protein [Streptomyces sp. NBRC 110611]|nr:hypothetical protein [Streptomyces sp. NBRC 110611]
MVRYAFPAAFPAPSHATADEPQAAAADFLAALAAATGARS